MEKKLGWRDHLFNLFSKGYKKNTTEVKLCVCFMIMERKGQKYIMIKT